MADITKERLVVITGGVALYMQDAMCLRSDAAPAWVTLVPIEQSRRIKDREAAGNKEWPRERYVHILHEMSIGTVDELVGHYREQLTRTFETMSGGDPMAEQQDTLARNGYATFAGSLPAVPPEVYEGREASRAAMRGRAHDQCVWERGRLMLLVANYGSAGGDIMPPTDDPAAVQRLIDALTVLRDDAIQGG